MIQYAMDACCSGLQLVITCYNFKATMSATHIAKKDGLSKQEYMCSLMFYSLHVATHIRHVWHSQADRSCFSCLTSCLVLGVEHC